MIQIPFNNSYVHLGDDFYVRTIRSQFTNPELIIFNHALSDKLGISGKNLNSPEGAAIFAGNVIPEGAEPLAMAYSGHQFGQFNPQLVERMGVQVQLDDPPVGGGFLHHDAERTLAGHAVE